MVTVNMIILIPFLAAILIPLLSKRLSKVHIGWIVLFVPAALFIGLARYIPSISKGERYVNTIEWIPSFHINFTTYLDGLSMIFGLLITGIGTLVILYSIYYLSVEESLQHFYIYLLLFMGSMLGVVFSDHLLVLYVFWELTSISSFLLIAFWFHRKRSRYGAQKALLITVSGGLAMLTSFIMLFIMTGTMSIRETIALIDLNHPLFIPALILLLLGAFTKSAQFPFHIWLPDAMEAPTPVSAYLHSATMVKAGIYLVGRFTPIFGSDEIWFWLVTSIGLITLFWGSFTAVRQTDLKALLAYSTVSQLGLIMSLFGIGSIALHLETSTSTVVFTQAAFAALFHLVNHSTFKGSLFMVVGMIDHTLGTRDIRRLGGLMAFMPISFTVAMIGSFSMAGLPPFNGFLSKEMFFTAILNVSQLDLFSFSAWGILLPVVAWIASVFTFVYSMLIVFQTFFGSYKKEAFDIDIDAHEAPAGMLISPIILATLVLTIFFFPNVLGDYVLRPAMTSIYPSLVDTVELGERIAIWHGWNRELLMTIGVVIFGSILYRTIERWKGVYQLLPKTWTFDSLYYQAIHYTETSASSITKFYMTGVLRDYLVYIYLFFVIVVGGTLLTTGAVSFNFAHHTPVSLFEWIIIIVMIGAAMAILFATNRVVAILLNGVLGFGIATLFVLFRAPDLALTQIVVETVTTVLFLVCFLFLPKWEKETDTAKKKWINGLISISVGVIFVTIALSVQNEKLFQSISVYFENAYELTGGKNIVNAILGDFRAFDTMLEVVVLFIAGIGVYSLTRLKTNKEGKNVEDQ